MIKNTKMKRLYGLSLDEYRIMIYEQNNKCAICNKPETMIDYRSKEIKDLYVDHNHETGKVRELLCSSCNQGIGLLQESLEILTNALNYLKKHA